MAGRRLELACTEYHTAGEPFRIVAGGFAPLAGADMLEKRRHAQENLDHLRELVINEPRGHADMYGCFVTEPVAPGSSFGAVFFHNQGYSTACGHGTIALATWAIESGLVGWDGTGAVELAIDVPSGTMLTRTVRHGSDLRVTFRNVPAYVHSTGHRVGLPSGTVSADIAYGGAFYASVNAADLDLPVVPSNVGRFIALGRLIKAELEGRLEIADVERPDINGIYGVIFFEDAGVDGELRTQRNVTVFADGEVDRSPCGSGTSARLALLAQSGFSESDELRHLSIIDTEFRGRIVGGVGDHPAGHAGQVHTEITGSAHIAAHHVFVITPGDPLPHGFLLRRE
jgi:proline racemase/trans-L-3-hydroxyproline dehydratase